MRRLAPLLLILGTACADGHGVYASFEKAELGGTWALSTDTGEVGEVGFVFDERVLLAIPIDAEAPDSPLLGWPVEAHVAVDGDDECPAGLSSTIREGGGVPWYLRSRVAVDWSLTYVFDEGPLPSESIPLDPEERVDPVAAGERAGGELRALDVPARFDIGVGEARLVYHLERTD